MSQGEDLVTWAHEPLTRTTEVCPCRLYDIPTLVCGVCNLSKLATPGPRAGFDAGFV